MADTAVARNDNQIRSFENSFWGKDDRGVEALMNKMRKAKQTCNELKTMFSARAALEEEYSKKLLKIAKTDLSKDESGMFQKSLSRLRSEFESTANAHMELSQSIRTELENSLQNFVSGQRERRKAQAAIIEKSSKSKSIKHANLLKVKEKYLSEKSKASASSDPSINIEKVQQRQQRLKTLEQEYTQLSAELEEATRIWQHDWRVSCRAFQELEEERLAFLKKLCWEFTNLVATVCVKDDESCEKIRTALQNVHPSDEIQVFINERGTGFDPDYEVDGSPICEIPKLDAPIESHSSTSTNAFTRSGPASFLKKAFNRPTSFSSASSLFGSSHSLAETAKSKLDRKNSASHLNRSESYDEPSPLPDIKSNGPLGKISVGSASTPQLVTSPTSEGKLGGNSSSSLVNYYEEIEAEERANYEKSLTQDITLNNPSRSNSIASQTTNLVGTGPDRSSVLVPAFQKTTPSAPSIPQQMTAPVRPLFFVRVLYDYMREMEQEMSIQQGQVIAVLSTYDDGWWEGEFVDHTTGATTRGIFPSNYTQPIE